MKYENLDDETLAKVIAAEHGLTVDHLFRQAVRLYMLSGESSAKSRTQIIAALTTLLAKAVDDVRMPEDGE